MVTVAKFVLNLYIMITFAFAINEVQKMVTFPIKTEVHLDCSEIPSTAIRIDDIDLKPANLQCQHAKCTLSDNDITEIERNCNGKTFCTFSVEGTNSNECLKDFGYFNFSYLCENKVHMCNFTNGWCNWTSYSENSDFQWTTIGGWPCSGYCMYITSANGKNKDEAYLYSEPFAPSQVQCLSFKHRAEWTGISKINLYIFNNTIEKKFLWTENPKATSQLITETINVRNWDRHYRLVFEAVRGNSDYGIFLLDDISISNTPCEGESPQRNSCMNVTNSMSTWTCSSHYLEPESIEMQFDPSYEECGETYKNVEEAIRIKCNTLKQENGNCVIDISDFLTKSPHCFLLNRIYLEYSCIDAPELTIGIVSSSFVTVDEPERTSVSSELPALKVASNRTNTSTYTIVGICVGVIGVLIIIAVLMLLFYKRRCLSSSKESTRRIVKGKVSSDCTRNQNISLQNMNKQVLPADYLELYARDSHYQEINTEFDISSSQENKTDYTLIGSEKDYIDINDKDKDNGPGSGSFSLVPNETGYDHFILSQLKKTDSANSKSYDLVTDECHAIASSVAVQNGAQLHPKNQKGQTNTDNIYVILDPKDTGFDQSNDKNIQSFDYELAFPLNNYEVSGAAENVNDPYVRSATGDYDSSINIQHKASISNLYSHTVDNVYDTSCHARKMSENEDDYDHF